MMLPPLNAPIFQVLMEIKNKEFVKCPGKIKTYSLYKNKYYEFHKDHGHNTKECFQWKEQIADLIKGGYLRKFVTDRPRPDLPNRGYANNRPTALEISNLSMWDLDREDVRIHPKKGMLERQRGE